SLVLAASSQFTAPYRKANEKAEKVRNFLSALEINIEPQWDSKTLLEVFDKNVRERKLGEYTLYENVSDQSNPDVPLSVAVLFSGPGLWAPIEGVMALETDLLTIRGIRFYKQEETPGLGGEIGSDWFQEQFKGKKIVSGAGEPGFKIVKPGSATDENTVNGVSGATMTSERVQTILDSLAKKLWEERDNYVK
ncbi:MAG TPA: FMN-binding protein, partial [Spirochaetes bacterium]|nr:FMN-binding protein [Spirochaetota bacterium]